MFGIEELRGLQLFDAWQVNPDRTPNFPSLDFSAKRRDRSSSASNVPRPRVPQESKESKESEAGRLKPVPTMGRSPGFDRWQMGRKTKVDRSVSSVDVSRFLEVKQRKSCRLPQKTSGIHGDFSQKSKTWKPSTKRNAPIFPIDGRWHRRLVQK